MHKIKSQLPDKYDIKSFEHPTKHRIMSNWAKPCICLFVELFAFSPIVITTIYIQPPIRCSLSAKNVNFSRMLVCSCCMLCIYLLTNTVPAVCVCAVASAVPSVRCRLTRWCRYTTAVRAVEASVSRVRVIGGRCRNATGEWSRSVSVMSATNRHRDGFLVWLQTFRRHY